jgi:hypothetical protein
MRELTCKELDAVAGGLHILQTDMFIVLPKQAQAPLTAPAKLRVRPIPGEPRPA